MIPLGRISGQVLVNDQPMDAAHFRRVSGYVTQHDALFPQLTVEETLMYNARLRGCGGRNVAAARVRAAERAGVRSCEGFEDWRGFRSWDLRRSGFCISSPCGHAAENYGAEPR
uniref:Uncharacterized protein n=1 Tax=Nelumbo nucifera TaxID=4432 RepID=A0A822YCC5_NELNU|nr:TPA_asm: hypothetical protein HUJ06_010615 [Nelumbo nucifera]